MEENKGQLSPEELALIKGYYDKVIQLVRYNKNKDEAIDRISKENEHYRTGFNQWVYKPLAMSIISMRENCKRELAGMEGREFTAERLRRNFGLLAEELDSIIIDNGGDITEDDVLYDGRSILQPLNYSEEEEEAEASAEQSEQTAEEQPAAESAEQAAEAPAEAEKTEQTEEAPAPTLAELLEGYQKQITDLLADNAALEKTLSDALEHNAEIDAENKFRLVYPVMKEIYLFSDAYHEEYYWLYEGGFLSTSNLYPEYDIYDDPAALKEMYMDVLGGFIEELLVILEKLGVTTLNNVSDVFDPTCQQVAKNIPTEVEGDDRKIANYVTDGYMLEGKLIYRQKVDIYKLKK